MMPIQVISSPDAHQERMVISDFRAPTAKCATRLIPNEAMTASRPPEKKNGIIGTKAPIAVEMPADKAATSLRFLPRDFLRPLLVRAKSQLHKPQLRSLRQDMHQHPWKGWRQA